MGPPIRRLVVTAVSCCLLIFLDKANAQVCSGSQRFDQNTRTGRLSVGRYGDNYLCYWRITVPSSQVVRLTFSSVRLAVRPYCGADQITIRDHNDNILRQLCGTWDSPPVVVSPGNTMSVLFSSDNTRTSDSGFSASWTAISRGTAYCQGLRILSSGSGTFSSTSINANYPNLASCSWRISVSGARSISLTFTKIDLEPQWTCSHDRVIVYDGPSTASRVLATRCNNRDLSTAVVSAGSSMLVTFTSDSQNTGSGFEASYTSTVTPGPGTPDSVCTGRTGYEALTSSSGTLSTMPGGYQANQACLWDIRIATNKIVVLTLTLNLPSSCRDSLRVIDQIGRDVRYLCSSASSGQKVTSGSNRMRLYFTADSIQERGRGFSASWVSEDSATALCQTEQTLTGSTGTITNSQGRIGYPNNENCRWRITVQSGRSVVLTFTRIDLESSPGCSKDSIRVYDGRSTSSRLVQTLCSSGSTTRLQVTSSGNSLYVVFRSDASGTGEGFEATYTTGGAAPPPGPPGTTPAPPTPTTCGTPQLTIIRGPTFPNATWPWMVSIRNRGRIHYCGGSLISPSWVITAAHCTTLPGFPVGYTAVLGITNRLLDIGTVRNIDRLIRHPDYTERRQGNSAYYLNDIALLHLSTEVLYQNSILPVCLPSTTDLLPRTDCRVSGWGTDRPPDEGGRPPPLSAELLQTLAPIEYDYYCDFYLSGKFNSSIMICAGYYDGFATPCRGDSGGPLGCKESSDEERYFLHGIISFNNNCGTYGSYTRVNRFLPWIRSTMQVNG